MLGVIWIYKWIMTKQKAGENMPSLTTKKLTAVLVCFLVEVDKQKVEINKSLEILETKSFNAIIFWVKGSIKWNL